MNAPTKHIRAQGLERVSMACGAFVLLVGIAVLAGWLFGLPGLKGVAPGWVTMKANTGLGFVLAGLALLLLSGSPVSPWKVRAGWLLAVLVAFIGALTLLEYFSGWNLGLDESLFRDDPAAVATGSAGRMAPTTALNFLLLGLSLLLIDCELRHRFRPAEALVVLPLLVSLASLMEYALGAPTLLALPQFSRIALHTAATFMVLATGVLFARPARGLVGEIHGGLVDRMERRVYLALALSLAVLFAIGLASIHNANDSAERSRSVQHSHEIRAGLSGLLSTMQDLVIGVRGFLLTGDDQFLQPYYKALDELESRYHSLQFLIADNPVQAARLREFERFMRARMDLARRSVQARRAQGFDAALPSVAECKPLMDSMRAIAEQMDAEEARLLVARTQQELDAVPWTNLTILLGTGVALGIVSLAGVALHRDFVLRQRAEEALRESEQRLTLASASGEVGVWDLDLVTGQAWRSLPHDRIFGYESLLPSWNYEVFSSHVVPEDREPMKKRFDAALQTGRFQFECRILRADNVVRWISAKGETFRNTQGQPIRMAGVVTDITERKRAEETLRKAHGELQAANKELEAFTYSVSHDLRAPLRHVDGFSKILADGFSAQLPAEARRCLDRIRAGARHMGQLVDDLLNLSRIGRKPLALQATALDSLVKEALVDLADGAVSRPIEWRIGPLPFVECDPALLKHVFNNLLSNALKYTRPRSPAVIEVGTIRQPEGPVIFVRDNGVGFSMKYADKLFGVFQRLHRPEDFEGTGVGLATVQRIVQKHGGRVWAEAELDKGATFYFTLGSPQAAEAAPVRSQGDADAR